MPTLRVMTAPRTRSHTYLDSARRRERLGERKSPVESNLPIEITHKRSEPREAPQTLSGSPRGLRLGQELKRFPLEPVARHLPSGMSNSALQVSADPLGHADGGLILRMDEADDAIPSSRRRRRGPGPPAPLRSVRRWATRAAPASRRARISGQPWARQSRSSRKAPVTLCSSAHMPAPLSPNARGGNARSRAQDRARSARASLRRSGPSRPPGTTSSRA